MANAGAVGWLRSVAQCYLDFPDDAFAEMVATKSRAGRDGAALDAFLGPATGPGTSLFVFATESTVEEPITEVVRREVPVEDDEAGGDGDGDDGDGDNGQAGDNGHGDDGAGSTGAGGEDESKDRGDDEAKETGSEFGGVDSSLDGSEGAGRRGARRRRTRIVEETVTRIESRVEYTVSAALEHLPEGKDVAAVFFLKSADGPIRPVGADEVDDVMAASVEFGELSADTLTSLEYTLKQVFLPILEPQLGGKTRAEISDSHSDDFRSVISGLPLGGQTGPGSIPGSVPGSTGGGSGGIGGAAGGGGGEAGGRTVGFVGGSGASVAPGGHFRGGAAGLTSGASVLGGGGGGAAGGGGAMGRWGAGGGGRPSLLAGGAGLASFIGGASGGASVAPGAKVAFAALGAGGPGAASMLSGAMQHGGGGGGGGGGADATGLLLPRPQEEDRSVEGVAEGVKSDFRSSLQRFRTQVSHTIQTTSGDVQLNVPDLDIDDPAAAVEDEEVRAILLDAVLDWKSTITSVLTAAKDRDRGKGPLGEIEYWRQKNATLGALFEQVNAPRVKRMLQVLELGREPQLHPYLTAYQELNKAHVEATENVKYLETLERHFKNLQSGNLATIADTVSPMLFALRMVWLSSRHYSSDDDMGPLIQRISNEILERVGSEINLKSILRREAADALKTLQLAKDVLTSWHSTYDRVREQIEKDNESRWEFDRRTIFGRTDYMATVVDDVITVVTTVDQFNRFFSGPELKIITSDQAEINFVIKMVKRLTRSFLRLGFNAYDRAKESKWRQEMLHFDEKVRVIEGRTQQFIDHAFDRLRSSEAAFDLLVKLQDVQLRETIQRQLLSKQQHIVAKARAELAATRTLFEANKDNPPVFKNYPPVAGAIAWAHSLYLRQKRPIVRFRATMPTLLASRAGQEYKDEYLRFAKTVDAYVKQLYGGWASRVELLAAKFLKEPVLGPPLLDRALLPADILTVAARGATSGTGSALAGGGGASAAASAGGAGTLASSSSSSSSSSESESEAAAQRRGLLVAAAAASAATCLQEPGPGVDSDAMRMPPPPFYVNFAPELYTLIREAKLLDRLGFEIPESALNVTLQETKFLEVVARLRDMLAQYHTALSGLRPVEANLLQNKLAELRAALRPGFTPLNWNSLHIAAYIESVNKALREFSNVLSQVRKNGDVLENVAQSIASTVLFREEDLGDRAPMEMSELDELIQSKSLERLEALVAKYKSVQPVMEQIEGTVVGTSTRCAPQMAEFYSYWERKFFNAIARMVIATVVSFFALLNLQNFKRREERAAGLDAAAFARLGGRAGGGGGGGGASSASSAEERPPLMKLRVMHNLPNVTMTPSFGVLTNWLTRCVHFFSNRGVHFTRWIDGTCMEVQVDAVDGATAPDFSYNADVNRISLVTQLATNESSSRFQLVVAIKSFTGMWDGYGRKADLWVERKQSAMDKLVETEPPCAYFDARLSTYARLAVEVDHLPAERDIGFFRVDCTDVAAEHRRRAAELVRQYGRVLHDIAENKVRRLQETWSELLAEMDIKATDLDALKRVLGAVQRIKDMRVDCELECADVAERFRTLRKYSEFFDVDAEEAEQGEHLLEAWQDVYDAALTKDARLKAIKTQFTRVTQTEVAEFAGECRAFQMEFLAAGPGSSSVALDRGLDLMTEYKRRLADFNRRREQLSMAEKLFGLDISRYAELAQVSEDLDKLSVLYDLYAEQKTFAETNSNMLWVALDISALTRGSEAIVGKLRKLPKELKALNRFKAVEEDIQSFATSLPLIVRLKDDAMKERHWNKLMDLTGVRFSMNPKTFTLQGIFEMQLARFEEVINEIVVEATQELKLERDLRSIEERWRNTAFETARYTKNGQMRGFVLRPADEIKSGLEDHMLQLQTMAGSRFVSNFADQVQRWSRQLTTVSETIDQWFVVQQKWQYLESIFVGNEDIKLQLPKEAKRFATIDKEFKAIMTEVSKNPNVLDATLSDNRLDVLNKLGEELDGCQKSLSEYLNSKRNAFPRFFFISDDELLAVLGSSDPTGITEHLLKLYNNVQYLGFGRGNKVVQSMTSSEGESFRLRTLAPIDGAVEVWMNVIDAEMFASLRQITKEGVFNYAGAERLQWIRDELGMVGMVGSQIWWTWETEDTFRRVAAGDKYAMKKYAEKLTRQLLQLVAMVRQDLDHLTRPKVNALLIVEVHARDIIDQFVRDSILDAREFAWESQLRFYWDRDVDDIRVRQCTGEFGYGYDYMGLNGRLVITPLTDRCYMTLTQALTFKLGGAPAGPAGTGKTETVKDLAKNLALACYVQNCGEGLDYKALGSTFSGLAQVGAWGCFDEFNRINIEVLSVVSAQLRSIQNALIYRRDTADIGLGQEIRINPRVGVFITMNPGYAGRTELPDNLKALFRPVTMVVPDMLQICEIMLFSEGFESARVLAKKMTTLYKLAREQLSKQKHYDFGLRALKSVLVMAGGLKRAYSDMSEELVLMRSLRDSNLPKFVFEDVPLFKGLIEDLFPGLDCPRIAYPTLKAAVEEVLEAKTMHHDQELVFQLQVDKCIQLYEVMLVRHTTMIVGPTGGGKSVVLTTLQESSRKAFEKSVKTFMINPKAQTIDELYGFMDPATREWHDGILSNIYRECNKPLPPGKENEVRWIVLDGDVDAKWVENMNSVMDDNKLLTLPNGERHQLKDYCKIVIEVFDLRYASPATVSRCGMVYVDPKNLRYRPYYWRWAALRAKGTPPRPTEREHLMDLFNKYVPKCVEFVLEGDLGDGTGDVVDPLDQAIPVSNLSMVKQLCSVLDATLPRDQEMTDYEVLEGHYIFALVWSMGAALPVSQRERFAQFLAKIVEVGVPENPYEHFYDADTRKWIAWAKIVPDYEPPRPFEFHRILVPTIDSVLYTWLLERMRTVNKPALFVGESGTAKTVTVQNFLRTLNPDHFQTLNISFSSRTTSMDVQVNIEANVNQRTGKTYGPPVGKKLMIFVDDLNMPKVDEYGTQQPIALLLFLLTREQMYDRKKDRELRNYKDLMFVAAMGPPGGGRNAVDPRFVALYSVFNLTPPTEDVLQHIYGSILARFIEPFPDPVKEASVRLTPMMLSLYASICEKLPPTPSKFHYVFNLRDLGRVYEGLCLATPDVVHRPDQLVRLWRNECMRIFGDRLTSTDDHDLVTGLVRGLLEKQFAGEVATEALREPLVFGDFKLAAGRIVEEREDPRIYQDLGGYADVRHVLDEVLENYNFSRKPMTLVLFEMALEHVTRILRIIRMPRGNALLVGVGGSGKQSLTRLATYTAGYHLFEVTLTRNYGEKEFREDLKNLYKLLGQREVVFLFTDAHVIEEGFLESINNMLTAGMVPALYEPDEKDTLANSVREEVKAAKIYDTNENCWNFYVNKCRNNMHLVLAMSPSGEALRRRCRNFPGLVSNTVIDWFFPWPEDALRKVASFFLREEAIREDFREPIVNHMVHVHVSVVNASHRFEAELRRMNYVTPKNYLDFISNYRRQVASHRKRIQTRSRRLEGGLAKLNEAQTLVDRMSIDLRERKKVVEAKTRDVEALIRDIEVRQRAADESRRFASEKQAELAVQAVEIAAESAKAEEELKKAEPALEAAAAALKKLDPRKVDEVRGMASPPSKVQFTMYCVYALRPTGKEGKDPDWAACRAMMSTAGFLNYLINYNWERLDERMIAKVRKYIEIEKLSDDALASASVAASALWSWIKATLNYFDVARAVEPLKRRVRDMERRKEVAEQELAEITERLSHLEIEIRELNENFARASSELSSLQEQAARMERQLAAASKLIAGLGSERQRWGEDVEALKLRDTRLVGDCLLSASFLSYLGPFTYQYRIAMLMDDWAVDVRTRGLPTTTPFNLVDFLASEATVQRWVAEGLPADDHSVMNGILTTESSRFPLCIDPQQQAVAWISNREREQGLKKATLLDSDFMRHLELAVQYGQPFLFENVDEELDPMIDAILEKNTHMEGSQRMIKLGDKTIEWHDEFRLFLTSKLANPHYSPEIMGKTMIINYSVTLQGLENQLLNEVVSHERPDLERQFRALVEDMSRMTRQLEELEETLLRNLNASQGNILDNEELIHTLEEAKASSVEIKAKLEESKHTKENINRARAIYKPAAKRGSILFFAMSGLSNIMRMYEISLASFLSVFGRALKLATPDLNVERRLDNIVREMTQQMYEYTCTGIFERHKLMFSFQMTIMIMEGEGELNRTELDFFLKGDTSLAGPSEPKPAVAGTWLSDQGWKDLVKLGSLGTNDSLTGLVDDFKRHADAWRAWYDLETPETTPFPCGYSEKLNHFEHLLLLRCFRADRVYSAVKLFVMHRMGDYFVQPPVLDYRRIFNQSHPLSPVVFILSPGADPQTDIQALGNELGFQPPHKFRFLALGQGQAPKAVEMLEAGMTRGYWIMLQNCHLLLSWMQHLEKMLQDLKEPHPDFRLWLTTEPNERFPLGILQRSLKVVTEPPDGLKLNMRSLYSKLTPAELDACPHPAYRPVVYVLCFLHAVVLERRKYGKIGWNVSYDFNESDFKISRQLLGLYLTKAWENGDELIPWGSLKYLIGDAMYGGRVSDDLDRRILVTYLNEYMGDFLFDPNARFFFSRIGFEYDLPDFSTTVAEAEAAAAAAAAAATTSGGRGSLSASASTAVVARTGGPGAKGGGSKSGGDGGGGGGGGGAAGGEAAEGIFHRVLRSAGEDLDAYRAHVEGLPLLNSPAVFGLHPNAEIGYFSNATKQLWRNLIELQPRTSSLPGGVSRDDLIAKTASEIREKIPEPEDLLNLRKSFSADGGAPSPTQIVLLQELERWNALVAVMESSLADLSRALVGEIGMSDELEKLGSSLFNGFLPSMWREFAPDTEKSLGSWMVHFSARHAQYLAWIQDGEPAVMWLSGLHIPESYLTALVQMTCRRKNWPLDKSTLYTRVTPFGTADEVPAALEDGCYVRGLYLEGASWDRERHVLRRQDPKVLVVELPILQVIPIEAAKLKLQGTFRTPVYVTQNRRNAMGVGLVFEADLATHEHTSHWVLQGVALCLNTDA